MKTRSSQTVELCKTLSTENSSINNQGRLNQKYAGDLKVISKMVDTSERFIAAIDQGTSSSRVLLFRPSDWTVAFVHQHEFKSIYPNEGWCEQDPMMILDTVKQVQSVNIYNSH